MTTTTASTRKTVCQDCKPMARRASNGTRWWCNGCGEWEIVAGKPIRPRKG